MAGLGDSVGEGGDGGLSGQFNTGFQTHFGSGNVSSGYREKQGTGYDDEGNVKTRLADQMAGFHYDPGVTPWKGRNSSWIEHCIDLTGKQLPGGTL
jgi:hypothetical protein